MEFAAGFRLSDRTRGVRTTIGWFSRMADSQEFILPWPTSTNSLWRAYKGRNILSRKAREWATAAKGELLCQRARPVYGPVRLSFALSSPTRRAFDLSNRIKIVEDVLVDCGIIERDDCTIVKHIEIGLGSGFTGVKVTVTGDA